MTGNQMMDYYVRPRHLYSHSRTCTRSRGCRRTSRLMAFNICYLLNRASVHEISALVTWFQYMSDISSHYGDLDLLYIFSHFGDHGSLYIFIMEILIYEHGVQFYLTLVVFIMVPQIVHTKQSNVEVKLVFLWLKIKW